MALRAACAWCVLRCAMHSVQCSENVKWSKTNAKNAKYFSISIVLPEHYSGKWRVFVCIFGIFCRSIMCVWLSVRWSICTRAPCSEDGILYYFGIRFCVFVALNFRLNYFLFAFGANILSIIWFVNQRNENKNMWKQTKAWATTTAASSSSSSSGGSGGSKKKWQSNTKYVRYVWGSIFPICSIFCYSLQNVYFGLWVL